MLLKKLKYATVIDIYNLAAKKDFIALKVEVVKLDIIKLVKIATDLNDLKTKGGDLDGGNCWYVEIENRSYRFEKHKVQYTKIQK